jgi:ParB family chromosome partitioning protein
VARVNPVRFRPQYSAPLGCDDVLERMMKVAAKFNPEKIKVEDLARSGGPMEEGG